MWLIIRLSVAWTARNPGSAATGDGAARSTSEARLMTTRLHAAPSLQISDDRMKLLANSGRVTQDDAPRQAKSASTLPLSAWWMRIEDESIPAGSISRTRARMPRDSSS